MKQSSDGSDGSPLTNKYAEGYPARDITEAVSVWMLPKNWQENAQKTVWL